MTATEIRHKLRAAELLIAADSTFSPTLPSLCRHPSRAASSSTLRLYPSVGRPTHPYTAIQRLDVTLNLPVLCRAGALQSTSIPARIANLPPLLLGLLYLRRSQLRESFSRVLLGYRYLLVTTKSTRDLAVTGKRRTSKRLDRAV